MLSRNLVVRQQFTTYITQKFHPGLVIDFLFYDFHFCLVAIKTPFDVHGGEIYYNYVVVIMISLVGHSASLSLFAIVMK